MIIYNKKKGWNWQEKNIFILFSIDSDKMTFNKGLNDDKNDLLDAYKGWGNDNFYLVLI